MIMINQRGLLAPDPQRPQGAYPLFKFPDVQNGARHVLQPSDSSPSSRPSSSMGSRASTPDSLAPLEVKVNPRRVHVDIDWKEKIETFAARGDAGEDTVLVVGAAGRQPEEVYTRTLSWWRAGIRRMILRNVEWESQLLATMQERVRHPWLDQYFVYTSTLGTHTFFMIMLPIFFFFGWPKFGQGLLLVLAAGVYLSSVIKDLFCSPRPFAPPVTRLTVGNHHLEYGFPSTHSTNSVSIALFFYDLLQQLSSRVSADGRADPAISDATYTVAVVSLLFYVCSIVYGRLYTGMHSFTDCAFGVSLGVGIWGAYHLYGEYVDAWVRNSGFIVPGIIIPLCLYLVHRHPQPVDDCPCFEDAIAFNSVAMGQFVSTWYMTHYGFDETFFVRPMPGASWSTWADVGAWWAIAAIKMVIGILAIFIWRIVAKSFCHFVLPPTFRFLSHVITLPHRRFYTPATDYTSVPPEKGLHPIPSVIDLPHMVEFEVGLSAAVGTALRRGAVKQRAGKIAPREEMSEKSMRAEEDERAWGEPRRKPEQDVKHYDADVLTKVFVYCGIGILAIGVIPVMFEVLGWGVKMS